MIYKPELIAIMMADLPNLSLIDSDIIDSFTHTTEQNMKLTSFDKEVHIWSS